MTAEIAACFETEPAIFAVIVIAQPGSAPKGRPRGPNLTTYILS